MDITHIRYINRRAKHNGSHQVRVVRVDMGDSSECDLTGDFVEVIAI